MFNYQVTVQHMAHWPWLPKTTFFSSHTASNANASFSAILSGTHCFHHRQRPHLQSRIHLSENKSLSSECLEPLEGIVFQTWIPRKNSFYSIYTHCLRDLLLPSSQTRSTHTQLLIHSYVATNICSLERFSHRKKQNRIKHIQTPSEHAITILWIIHLSREEVSSCPEVCAMTAFAGHKHSSNCYACCLFQGLEMIIGERRSHSAHQLQLYSLAVN